MLTIFNGSNAEVLDEWIDKLTLPNSTAKLSNEQKIAFLETAERKVAGENRPALLKSSRERLAELYINIGQFEKAADCLGRLREAATTAEEKEKVLPALLKVYLSWQKPELVATLLENILLQKDLGQDSELISSIDDYMNKTAGTAEANAFLEAISAIKIPQSRTEWREQFRRWMTQHHRAQQKQDELQQQANQPGS
jgi:hypothetical protein